MENGPQNPGWLKKGPWGGRGKRKGGKKKLRGGPGERGAPQGRPSAAGRGAPKTGSTKKGAEKKRKGEILPENGGGEKRGVSNGGGGPGGGPGGPFYLRKKGGLGGRPRGVEAGGKNDAQRWGKPPARGRGVFPGSPAPKRGRRGPPRPSRVGEKTPGAGSTPGPGGGAR